MAHGSKADNEMQGFCFDYPARRLWLGSFRYVEDPALL